MAQVRTMAEELNKIAVDAVEPALRMPTGIP